MCHLEAESDVGEGKLKVKIHALKDLPKMPVDIHGKACVRRQGNGNQHTLISQNTASTNQKVKVNYKEN